MCESIAYVLRDDELEKVMDDVVSIDPYDNKLYLTDIVGNQKIIEGDIKEIQFMKHKIIIEEKR